MAVVPLTSVVTEVAFGAAPGASIEFLDGRRQTVALDALPDVVTESGNPRNGKGVRRAVVHHPAPLLREGVIIVDTPGVGSIFEHNTEATYARRARGPAQRRGRRSIHPGTRSGPPE